MFMMRDRPADENLRKLIRGLLVPEILTGGEKE
jgi:hypothetical protein